MKLVKKTETGKIVAEVSIENGYFSVCGEVYVNGRIDRCGQVTEDLHEHFPELKPLMDLHLSDLDGVPMHAVANGVYWAKEKNTPYLAKHLRISLEEASTLKPADIPEFVEKRKSVWKEEAEHAMRIYNEYH